MKSYVICDNISPNSSQNEKCFRKSRRENKNTFYVQYFYPLQSCLLWNNVEQCYRTLQATHGARALLFGQFSLQTHNTHSEYNTCFFSTTTIVTPTRLNITLYLHCMSYRNYRRENERNSFDLIIIRTSSIALDRPLFFQNIFRSFF